MLDYKIYTLSCPKTNVVRYVGRTTDKLKYRLSKHIYDRKKHKNHRCHWINKIYSEGLKPIIELIDSCDTYETCIQLEIYWIAQFKAWGFELVNETKGGEGSHGYKHSKESLKKIRDFINQRKITHPGKSRYKARYTIEERSLIISKARSKQVNQYDLDGNFIKTWNSATEIADHYNVHYSSISSSIKRKGISKTNFIFRFYSENITCEKIQVKSKHLQKC